MLAIDTILEVTRGRLILETQMIDDALLTAPGQFRKLLELNPKLEPIPFMQFYPGAVLEDSPPACP
jgi:hypothetical protein